MEIIILVACSVWLSIITVLFCIRYVYYYCRENNGPMAQLQCSINGYFVLTCTQIGTYLIVFISINRYIFVMYPLKVDVLLTRKRTYYAIFSTCIICAAYTVYTTFTFRAVGNYCLLFNFSAFHLEILSWTNIVINSFIPYTIVIVMNISIAIVMRKQAKFRQSSLSRESLRSSRFRACNSEDLTEAMTEISSVGGMVGTYRVTQTRIIADTIKKGKLCFVCNFLSFVAY